MRFCRVSDGLLIVCLESGNKHGDGLEVLTTRGSSSGTMAHPRTPDIDMLNPEVLGPEVAVDDADDRGGRGC